MRGGTFLGSAVDALAAAKESEDSLPHRLAVVLLGRKVQLAVCQLDNPFTQFLVRIPFFRYPIREAKRDLALERHHIHHRCGECVAVFWRPSQPEWNPVLHHQIEVHQFLPLSVVDD